MQQQQRPNQEFSIRKTFHIVFIFLVTFIVFTYFTVHLDSEWKLPGHDIRQFISRHKYSEIRMKQGEFKQPQWNQELLGEANLHIFEDWCGSSVDQLRKNQLFPLFPHSRTTISRLAVYPNWENYGLRIFGYIHPVVTGEYIFAISSDDNSEFWLSDDESTQRIKRVAYVGQTGTEWAAPGEYEKFASQTSQPIQLSSNEQYYFEVLFKQSEGMDHVEVAWRLNNDLSRFEVIKSEYLSLYNDESSVILLDTDSIPITAACQVISVDSQQEIDMVREDPRDSLYKLPLLKESYLQKVFEECDYKPIYIFDNKTIERYDGVNHVFYSSVYPNDYTRLSLEDKDNGLCFYKQDEEYDKDGGGFIPYLKIDQQFKILEQKEEPKKGKKQWGRSNKAGKKNPQKTAEKTIQMPNWRQVFDVKPADFHSKQGKTCYRSCKKTGNIVIPRKEVKIVVDAFMRELQEANKTDLVLKQVINVEKKANETVGSRYLIELEMEDTNGKRLLVSRYFFTTSFSTNTTSIQEPLSLCSPRDLFWNLDTMVNIILPVKNQGRWVKYFIKEMENLYKVTQDQNFNVIIVDFDSSDIDIKKELQNAKIPNFRFKKLAGRFAKTTGVQVAVDLVVDKNSIIFMFDLHISFPPSMLDTIRKHTIQGKMVYAPIVMRLDCGVTMDAPKGFWEIDGYGLLGIYKSDMDRIGGMNVKEFTDKWGGEDWELLDRIVLNKLEVERLNVRNFVHFFHTRRGMWNNTS